jgi:hypothetical protein
MNLRFALFAYKNNACSLDTTVRALQIFVTWIRLLWFGTIRTMENDFLPSNERHDGERSSARSV